MTNPFSPSSLLDSVHQRVQGPFPPIREWDQLDFWHDLLASGHLHQEADIVSHFIVAHDAQATFLAIQRMNDGVAGATEALVWEIPRDPVVADAYPVMEIAPIETKVVFLRGRAENLAGRLFVGCRFEAALSLDKVALAFSRQKTKQMSGKDTSLALYLSLSLSLSLTLVSPSLIAFVRAHSLSCCPFGLISVLSALSFHQEIPRNHRV